MERLPKKRWRLGVVFLLSGLCFWALGGLGTLAPSHINWLMTGWDTPAHYLGWQFFRHAPWWHWPVGMNPAYGADAPGSIVLADSIPLLAFPFKLFSPWFPPDFQYVGWWILACFLLQGWFAFKLMQHISEDAVVQLVGTAFFLTATIFLMQVYLHPSLGAQWTLLAALYLTLQPRFRAKWWVVLLTAGILIHAYLFLMAALLWGADMAQRLWRRELSCKRICLYTLSTTALITAAMWASGYFLPFSVAAQSRHTHTDLAFAFWPGAFLQKSWSRFLPIDKIGMSAHGGFGYFGLGFMLLCVTAILCLILRRNGSTAAHRKTVLPSTWIPLALVCFALFLYAVGNKVYLYGTLLFTYPQPDWLAHSYTIFRGAGRMMWPLWYLLMFGVFSILSRWKRVRVARCILILALLIQLADISTGFVHQHNAMNKRTQWTSALTGPTWHQLTNHTQHIVFLQPEGMPANFVTFLNSYKRVADYAAKNGMTINIAYLARENVERLGKLRAEHIRRLQQGKPAKNTLYVIAGPKLWSKIACKHTAITWYGHVDGMHVITRKAHGAVHEKHNVCVK